jgi:hypothetical protein
VLSTASSYTSAHPNLVRPRGLPALPKSKSVLREEAGFAAYCMYYKWAIENSHPQVYVSALVFSQAAA